MIRPSRKRPPSKPKVESNNAKKVTPKKKDISMKVSWGSPSSFFGKDSHSHCATLLSLSLFDTGFSLRNEATNG